GNTSTCTANVTVQDNTNPTAICQNATVVLNAAGNGSITTSDINNGSNDACGIASLSLNTTSFGCADVGNNTVTLTVTDTNGNVSTCNANVTVQDSTNPTAVCQNATVVLNAAGHGSITTADINNGSNDACGIVSLSLDTTSFDCSDIGNNTVTLTVTDTNGNISTCTATVTVQDNTNPDTPTLPLITGQCTATVPVPVISDICSGTITGTTSDPLIYNSQGAFAVTWNFDDGNGNDIDIVQNVLINDTTDPVAICQDITVQLDNTTGTATITGSQINNGSTDNCGVINFSVSQSSFDCTNIGSNVIVLTVDDGNGNTDTCTATVTITSPNISGGTLTGYLNNNQTIADADDLVEVTACPDEPQNATFTLTGHTGIIANWETSIDGGVNWTTITNTTNTYYHADILVTTLVRAVVQIGSCQANSTIVIMAVIPPDIPPTIIGSDSFNICLGADITVVAQSEFGINPGFNEGGMFNEANLNNFGWEVDGAAEMSAGGSNTNDTYWKETTGPKKFNGHCYESLDNTKFAVASGIPQYDAPDHTISPLTTLETNVFNTLGLSTAMLEFDQAYYLETGAWISVELSLDGGTTYPITLDPGTEIGGSNLVFDYTGPSTTGFADVGFTGQCNNNQGTYIDHATEIDLQNYIGLTNLRIRFSYYGTGNSSWAIDNISIPNAPINEIIEWTDETGAVVTTGSATTITPVTPGVQTYGVTSLINGCRSDGNEGTEFINVNASLAYAGKDIIPIAGECGETTISLNAFDNNLTAAQNITNGAYDNNYITGVYPGTGEAGVWSVVATPSSCGSTYAFSNIGNPRASFSGEAGIYTLRWTVAGCSSDVLVTLDNCNTVDFDGTNDYITFEDNYDINSAFSIETWVKPNSIIGTQSIISKRDADNLTTGFDLRLTNSTLSFNWNNGGTITSPFALTTSRWYHIAVTFSSGNYNLYIDGIKVKSQAGSAPTLNNNKFLAGAMDDTVTNRPLNYFNGWLDEIRIWNTSITQDQLRQMMNQQIQSNGNAVRGEIVPLDVPGVNWTNLDGYYRMDINCGRLTTMVGTVDGKLRNMYTSLQETAPIPYTSRVDGQNWATDNTWTHFSVWDAPNSIGVDGSTQIDWNITQISHNINSGNKDITVLGLISDTTNKELTITDPSTSQDETNDGQSLRVTHYLELDGNIDLVGESQLLQDEGSILAISSAGKLERDQQGSANLYNYNYWSSPVTLTGSAVNNGNYSVAQVINDGTNSNNPLSPSNWTTGQDANPSTTPITMSSRWLYAYENYVVDSYASWRGLTENDVLATGLSFTMKGSGVGGNPFAGAQNYVFIGKPNNGTISTPITIGNQALVGNPYASSIDAVEFILDNIPGGNVGTSQSIDGTLYFWEHYISNFTHVLEDYEGGYAAYNLTGGNAAVAPSLVSGNGTPSKIPGRYVPVTQGFFVTASNLGGNVTFHNDQRAFVRETSGNSSFLRTSTVNTSNEESVNNDIQRVRLEFISPEGVIRPLLLGFVPNNLASDAFDYGYDAENSDYGLPNDMSWMIEDKSYVIQGVGDFDVEKQYPLGLFLSTSGTIEIALKSLENFENPIDVFVYDSLLETYTPINDLNYQISLDAEDYIDRFYITFSSEDDTLSLTEARIDELFYYYSNVRGNIVVLNPNSNTLKSIEIFNILGQSLLTIDDVITTSYSEYEVENLSTGTYIIKIHTESGSVSKKVLVE
ncbi:hypothetical protein A9Q87_04665, partial [Flavobacteriales bacterium 34_180_T64]